SYWSPEQPKLYTVRTTLTYAGASGVRARPGGTHTTGIRTGFRAAVFRQGGPGPAPAQGRGDPQERAQRQHGPLLALPAVAALPGRLRRAGHHGLGGTPRLGVRRGHRVPAPGARQRPRHGGPRQE